MTDIEIYVGEDFAILMSAVADESETAEDLTDFEITVQLSTSSIGNKIIASTIDGRGIEIVRKGVSDLAINISHELTGKLTEGILTLSIILTHKQTDVQMIAETKTITIKRSKLLTL